MPVTSTDQSGDAADLAGRYSRDGFICPLPGIGADAADGLRAELESFEQHAGATLGKLPGQYRAKSHLLFPWLNELARHDAVLKPVRAIFGDDLLVYHVTCWLKEPGDDSFVSWHQDATYFYLDPAEHVTAWVALTPSRLDSGCVEVIPGTHRRGQIEHGTRPDPANLLSNGQTLAESVDKSGAVALELQAGQMSLHDTYLVHSSGPNTSGHRRIGIGISYVPTRVRYRGRTRVSATLACGEDRYGHFDPEPVPKANADPDAIAFHAEACERFFNNHGYARGNAKT
ncbi:MAG: phytanoyl-CoA dioxygenase family protein [Pseudomonadota bacterium]